MLEAEIEEHSALVFELMLRIKAIHSQRLYLPEAGQAYPNLDLALASRSIDWGLIEQQLDAMVKHAVAMKRGMADAESLLRRFTSRLQGFGGAGQGHQDPLPLPLPRLRGPAPGGERGADTKLRSIK